MFYRLTYEGYTEGEYDTEADALENFIENVREDLDDDGRNIVVNKFDEKTKKWE